MMKTQNHLFQNLAVSLGCALVLSACGNYSKQPVSDAKDLRAKAAAQDPNGQKPTPTPAQTTSSAPTTIEKDVTTVVAQAVVDERSLIVIADSPMSFTEGVGQSFNIKVRSTQAGTTVRLSSPNLPAGAVLKDISTASVPGVYQLSWAPDYSTILGRNSVKAISVKLIAQMILSDGTVKAGISKETDVVLSVFHDQSVPSSVAVENLPALIDEGTVTDFDVIADINDVNENSSIKPTVQSSYDQVAFTDGNQFLEMDGSRYVTADIKNKAPEYVGANKWRFHLVFDTKNISVQPQLSSSGKVIDNADGVRVRVSFKVFSPYGPASSEIVKQIKITFKQKPAQAAPAPAAAPASATSKATTTTTPAPTAASAQAKAVTSKESK
jgi:hypothetical protein